MKLRDFTEKDAEKIVGWIAGEREFYYWSADRYGHYPIKPEEITANYLNCEKRTFFKPMMFEADGKTVGHLIFRTPTDDPKVIRIGFIIIDKNERGKGYGKAMAKAGVDYAKNVLGATEVNLGVFEKNVEAIACYKSLGFVIAPDDGSEITSFNYKNEEWKYLKMVYNG